MENLYGYGWWLNPTPLKNRSSSTGMMTFPIYGKIKNGPNHQPVEKPWWLKKSMVKFEKNEGKDVSKMDTSWQICAGSPGIGTYLVKIYL